MTPGVQDLGEDTQFLLSKTKRCSSIRGVYFLSSESLTKTGRLGGG